MVKIQKENLVGKPKGESGGKPKGESGGKPKGGGGRKPKHRGHKPKNRRKPKQSETDISLDKTEENVVPELESLDKTEDNVVPELESLDKTEDNVVPELESLDKTEDNVVTQTEETPGPSDSKKRTAAPTNLQEPNILDGHLSEHSGLSSQHDKEDTEEEKTPPPSPMKIPTSHGNISITQHGIKKKRVWRIKVKCPVCNEQTTSQKECNIHLKQNHPDYKFVCETCKRPYDTYNAWYKHTQTHYILPHKLFLL